MKTLRVKTGADAVPKSPIIAIMRAAAAGTPAVQPVYIRLTPVGAEFELEVFFDDQGNAPMTNDKPLKLRGDGNGKIRFNFIKADVAEEAVTADLVIIAQTLADPDAALGQRRASPFKPQYAPEDVFYPIYYLPSPAGDMDPLNGVILGGTLDVIEAPGGLQSGPYKYTIVALCNGATKLVEIDPTVIINPN